MSHPPHTPPPVPANEDDAVRAHIEWLWRVNHILIQGLPVDEALVAPDSHLRCEFHAWLAREFDRNAADPAARERLAEIDQLHHQIHALARDLLLRYRQGESYDDIYEAFGKVVVAFNARLAPPGDGSE